MLTLFHAPHSRSTRIIWLLEELGVPYRLNHVTIRYGDGSGQGPDPTNPHPDKKVPALLHDDALITESTAIAIYLADAFREARLSPNISDRERSAFLTWICWIEAEFGPATLERMIAGKDADATPAFTAALGRLDAAVASDTFLLGETFSAADIMLGGALGWAQEYLPDNGPAAAYMKRLASRPAFQRAMARDAAPAIGA